MHTHTMTHVFNGLKHAWSKIRPSMLHLVPIKKRITGSNNHDLKTETTCMLLSIDLQHHPPNPDPPPPLSATPTRTLFADTQIFKLYSMSYTQVHVVC